MGKTGATLAVTEPGSYTVKVSASNGKTTSAEAESAPVEVAFGHFIDDVWQSDDHNHWQACTECGEKLNLGAHISDGGKVTTEATETTEGVRPMPARYAARCSRPRRSRYWPAPTAPTA